LIRVWAILIVVAALCLSAAGTASAQSGPEFKLGFKALADQIPVIVGRPLEKEHYSASGDSLQLTTDGLMVWRKADNWTAFTNGWWTWVNGPNGLESRLNTERLPWERGASRLSMGELKNAEYQVEKQKVQLSDGRSSLQPTGSALLLEQWTDFGDLDGDGKPDAAVSLVTQPGGSGSFYYLVAMLDRDGLPVQGAIAFLGDRVRIQTLAVANQQIRVRMLTQGPGDPMINPTLLVERGYRLSGGDFAVSN
jgi:hypothetical protein